MKRTSTTLIILILLCAAAGYGYFLMFEKIKIETKEAGNLINTIAESERETSRLSSLRQSVKQTEEKRVLLSALMLKSDSEVSFIEKMEELAKRSGLKVKTNVVNSVTGPSENMKIFQVQIQTSGSWNSIMYCLSQIENLPYNIKIQNAAILKNGKDGWTGKFDINISEII